MGAVVSFVEDVVSAPVEIVGDVVDTVVQAADDVVHAIGENIVPIAAIALAAYTGGASLEALAGDTAIEAGLGDVALESGGEFVSELGNGLDAAVDAGGDIALPETTVDTSFPTETNNLSVPEDVPTPDVPADAPSPLNLPELTDPSTGLTWTGEDVSQTLLSKAANALGLPTEFIDTLNNPLVSNAVSSLIKSGLTGQSLQTALTNALVSGVGSEVGGLAANAVPEDVSKFAGSLANYTTQSLLKGKSPDLGSFAIDMAVNTGSSALSNALGAGDAKPLVDLAVNAAVHSGGTNTPSAATKSTPAAGALPAAQQNVGTSSQVPTASSSPLTALSAAAPAFTLEPGDVGGDQIKVNNSWDDPYTYAGAPTTTLASNFSTPTDVATTAAMFGQPAPLSVSDLYFNPEYAATGGSIGNQDETQYQDPMEQSAAPEGHNPEFFSEGGMMHHYVKGGGTGTSDSIPAMLATGEFVIPADVVSGLGDGDNDSGAKVLDEFLAVIRKHKRAADSRELPPDSKGPLAYLASAQHKVGT